VPPVVSLHAKFEVSSSNRSRDMNGSHNSKIRSRDPYATPFDLMLVPLLVSRRAKCEVSSSIRSRDMEGVAKFQK